MKRMKLHASLAGAGLLTCAAIALAQTPPPGEPRPNPNPNQPPSQQPPPRNQPPAQRPAERPQTGGAAGHMDTPKYAQPLAGNVPANTIQVFADNEFKGDTTNLENVTKSHAAGTLNEFPADYDNAITSLRWHLTPGTLVVLFDDAAGKGPQLALWGKGQIPDLGKVDFNEKATRWASYDVGGGATPRSAGSMVMPHGAQALDAPLSEGSIITFDDQMFKGEERRVAAITSQRAGEWIKFPGEGENSLSSIRWSLPEGTVVILAAEDGGNDNIVLFGEGQYSDLGSVDFDNQASRWSWAHIGAASRDMDKPRDPNQPPARQPGGEREP